MSRKTPKGKNPFKHRNVLLNLEQLEDRATPSCNTISGFVYHDVDNDGHYDVGTETPIANSIIELREAGSNKLIDTVTTDANGFYKFENDPTQTEDEESISQSLTFALSSKFHNEGTIEAFNPELGKLTGVEIIHEGTISSEIEVENVSQDAATDIDGVVSGKIKLTAPGVTNELTLSGQAGPTFHATPYDDNLNYRGTSGQTFGVISVTDSNAPEHTWVTDEAELAKYTGDDPITITQDAIATTRAESQGGGDINSQIRSKTSGKVTVIYHYIPHACIDPGEYKIVQKEQPDGFDDGKEEKDGDVIPNSNTTDIITVKLEEEDLVNNNFGEVKLAQISGHVYHDADDDGVFDQGENPIAGTTVTLTGPGGVTKTTTTDAEGFYEFTGLAPGTYRVNETQPANFNDGKDTAGSKGGTVTNDQIADITLADGDNSINNDFGERKGATLSGYVYHDADNDGAFDDAEDPIAGTTVTLTAPDGTTKTTTTNAEGYYEFTELGAGTYRVNETQPANYLDGKDTAGSKGGTVTNDQIASITLAEGDNSQNNNFGELKPASIAGHVYYDKNNNGTFDDGETPIAGATVKLTGFDDLGPVDLTQQTNNLGEYKFSDLRPGTYALTETQPADYDDGKDKVGSQGGTLGNDVFSDIQLAAGVDGVDNDFGEIKPDRPGEPLPKTVTPLGGQLPIISKVQRTAIPEPEAIDPALRGQMAFVIGANITLTGQQLNTSQTLAAVAQLNSGVTPASYINQLWNSGAHQNAQVNTIYQSILNRLPTDTERAQAFQTLQTQGELALRVDLFSSEAYGLLHPTSEALVQGLYGDIFNKIPGTQATQDLLQSMDDGLLEDVVDGLVRTNESVSNLIDDVYRQNLRRPATSAEIATWLAPIKGESMTLDELGQRLLSSQEFYQLAYASIR